MNKEGNIKENDCNQPTDRSASHAYVAFTRIFR
jgi:hypothetical protein